MRKRRRLDLLRRRGFSLIEMIIALGIGALAVTLAANVAAMVFKTSGHGVEASDLSARTQVIAQQLRTDLRVAGTGSTGAVAVDPNEAAWGAMSFIGPPTFPAIAVVRGVDNVGAGVQIAGYDVMENSDVLQLVVPNPLREYPTEDDSAQGSNVVGSSGLPPFADCPFVYINDNSAPNGAGRTQFAERVDNGSGVDDNLVEIEGVLLFDVALGSKVYCARISTYFLDTDSWLHRIDFAPGLAVSELVPGEGLYSTDPAAVGADLMAPGVVDFQVAYGLSSAAGIPRVGDPLDRWAHDRDEGNDIAETALDGLGNIGWFEVRQVRVSLIARSLRRVKDANESSISQDSEIENNPEKVSISIGYSRHPLQVSEVLTNLRFFDMNLPEGVEAEPI